MGVIRKNAKSCSESRITLCLDAGWAGKGWVVVMEVRLNTGQQCMVTTNEADCVLSYPGKSMVSKSSDLTVSLHGMLVSSHMECCIHLWAALLSLISSREILGNLKKVLPRCSGT